MLTFFDPLRELTFLSIFARLVLAMVCGGAIGIEREYRRQAAGFRTHILICIGAATTTLISEYLAVYMHYYTDLARLGAQVIAGIGFMGAGSILKRGFRIRGLTTAAGLWTSAIVGLALGAGYFEAGIMVTILTEVVELLLGKIEHKYIEASPKSTIYVEYNSKDSIEKIIFKMRDERVLIENMEITQSKDSPDTISCAILYLNTRDSLLNSSTVPDAIKQVDGVIMVETL